MAFAAAGAGIPSSTSSSLEEQVLFPREVKKEREVVAFPLSPTIVSPYSMEVCTRDDVRRKVQALRRTKVVLDPSLPLESRKQHLYRRCEELVSTFRTTDEELMIHFATSLFDRPETMLSIAQQWERMSGHVIAPKELHGRGRVWTCLMHTMLSEGNLVLEMSPTCQSYAMKIYLYGMISCPRVEELFDQEFFAGTCMDVPKRVLSPSYLRFDSEFLPTLHGRGALNMLRRRNAFQVTSYRTGSAVCAVQSNLRPNLDFVFQTVFNHFRPCIVACLLVAMTWSAYKMSSSLFKERFSEHIASLLNHIGSRSCPPGLKGRMEILRTLLERYLENPGALDSGAKGGYTLETLETLYHDLWNTLG